MDRNRRPQVAAEVTRLGHVVRRLTASSRRLLLALGAACSVVAASPDTLHVPADLALDLVLRDPIVAQPVFLNFDARGRMWVVQYRQYPDPAGLKAVSRDEFWRTV